MNSGLVSFLLLAFFILSLAWTQLTVRELKARMKRLEDKLDGRV
jgi:uncharacterized membrane protein